MSDTPANRVVRPFVDRPIGDLAAATAAAHVAADTWGLPTPMLMRASMNAVYGAGDVVLRASTPTADATAALALADALLAAGIRVPSPRRTDVVVHEGVSVTCWERIEPVTDEPDWTAVGQMLRRLHGLAPSVVPAGFPLPSPVDFPWWDFDALMDDVGADLDVGARAGLRRAIDRHIGRLEFETVVLCHGDVHPGNVLNGADGPVLVDWDLTCLAPPAWDHGPMMTWSSRWGGPAGTYERLADGYGTSMRGDPDGEAFAELRLVAATLMRVRAARTDPAAVAEAQRRLAYWRGESDPVAWQAQ